MCLPLLLALAPLLPPQDAPTAAPRARFVRIELPGNARTLSLAEVEILVDGRNIAPAGNATHVGTANNGEAARAIDRRRDGNFNAGSVTHTPEAADAWWEVDLGSEKAIEQVTVWNRTDCCGERLEGFTLRLFDGQRAVVWERRGQAAPSPRADFRPAGGAVVEPERSPEADSQLHASIAEAINKGVRRLLRTQLRDGSWPGHQNYGPGETALNVYALLKSGVSPEHPALQRAFTWLEWNDPVQTYSASTVLLALGALGDEENLEWAERVAGLLLEWQGTNDGHGRPCALWGYPHDQVDLSNSQFAALGLRAAAKLGVEIPRDVWITMAESTLRFQESPTAIAVEASAGGRSGSGERTVAGFRYRTGTEKASGSMTTAGLGILAIAEEMLDSRMPRSLGREIATSKRLALDWMGMNFAVHENPGHGGWYEYYIYGLERVGALLGMDRIGTHSWYLEGASELVRRQAGGGEWGGDATTSFALLFLTRATARTTGISRGEPDRLYRAEEDHDEVRWRATGDTPMTMFLTGFHPHTIEDFSKPEDGVEGLRVVKVQWFADGEMIDEQYGDSSRAWAGQRFALQHSFDEPGEHELYVQVTVHDPWLEGESDPTEVLEGRSLYVRVEEVLPARHLEWAGLGRWNLLRDAPFTVQASSQNNDIQSAAKAADGYQATGWLAAANDERPRLTIRPERALRPESIAFAHYDASFQSQDQHDRATRIAVIVNGGDERYEVELDPRSIEMTRWEFPKRLRVREIEIEILERAAGQRWPGLVGFGEVILLGRETGGRRRR